MDKLNLGQSAGVSVTRQRALESLLAGLGAQAHVEQWRDGKKIHEETIDLSLHQNGNGIVDVGVNKLFDVFFHNQTQIATWYIGIVDNGGFSAFAAGDTMSSHAGWTEFTAYSESTRVEWVEGAASGRSITNPSPSVFNINGSGTLKGVFVTSDSTKSGTSGTLWATAAFASTVTVSNGDQLKVTYTVSG